MFPLFDLDDDALVATLGFSDPRTLCSITMTCRRLRTLADTALAELQKHIATDKREGGDTPRERVLSSFIVHQRKSWMHSLSLDLMFGKKESGMHCISSEQLQSQSHLLYCFAASGETNIKISSYLDITEDQYSMLGNHSKIDVPIKKERLKDNLRSFVGTYSGAEIASNLPIGIGDFFEIDEWEMTNLLEEVFAFHVIIVAVSRRTLARSIYFQCAQPRLSPLLGFLEDDEAEIYRSAHRPRRAEIRWGHRWEMRQKCQSSVFQMREIGFYFQDEEFGLMLQSA